MTVALSCECGRDAVVVMQDEIGPVPICEVCINEGMAAADDRLDKGLDGGIALTWPSPGHGPRILAPDADGDFPGAGRIVQITKIRVAESENN